ncbi:MAG TPA: HAMP domain-containing sensor histidine kinase [Solirubrobacteraceae bacterium]
MVALSLRARLLAALAYVLVVAIVALLVPLVRSVRARVNAEVRSQALAQAELVAASAPGTGDLAGLARRAGANLRGRVVIVGPRGRVRADSASAATLGADYSGRPEIRRALRGAVAQLQRASGTLGEGILATAVPFVVAGHPAGAVRVTQGMPAVHRAIDAATLGLTAIGGLVLVLGLAAGAVIAGQIAAPLRGLAGVARRVEGGEEALRAVEEGSSEQRALARACNDMTGRVARTLRAQRDFVADASHQLRTPLAGVRLRLEEAAVAAGDGPARTQIAGALDEVDRMASIVTELLVLSEAEQPAGRSAPIRARRHVGRRAAGRPPRAGVERASPRRATAGRCAAARPISIGSSTPSSTTRWRMGRRADRARGGGQRPGRGARRGRGRRAGGGRGRVRPLPSRHGRPRRPGRDRARPADRAGAGAALGRRRDARRPACRRAAAGGRAVRSVLALALAALAGLLLAVAVTYVASTLSSQHVGLSSEPLTAGEQLVPRAASPARPPTATPTGRSRPTATAPAPPAPPAPSGGDDSGGDD